jgi:phosphoglycolate phosphatase
MKPICIFFDLDGTLTDSGPGITASVAYALEKLGITPPEREKLRPFIGPPLLWSFAHYYGLDEDQCREGVRLYREYFTAGGMFENSVYPGIPEAMERLRAAGFRMAVATSKPEPFSRQIISHFRLDGYIEAVCGATMDETRTEKADVIRYALATLGAAPEESLMVGDREHDVLGARAAGVSCLGALWGYGGREELTKAGAFALAETPEDMAERILGL